MLYTRLVYGSLTVLSIIVLIACAVAVIRARGSREIGRLCGLGGFVACFAGASVERIVEDVRPPTLALGLGVFLIVQIVFLLRRKP